MVSNLLHIYMQFATDNINKDTNADFNNLTNIEFNFKKANRTLHNETIKKQCKWSNSSGVLEPNRSGIQYYIESDGFNHP